MNPFVHELSKEKTYGALITSAGLSSRIGGFKPLMDLGGKCFLRREIDTLREAGVTDVVIITGHRHQEIEEELAGEGITFLYNADYATSKMFDSVCLGLSWYKNQMEAGRHWDGIYFLPVDAPVFAPYTLFLEQQVLEEEGVKVCCPCYGGKPGHPLLISTQVVPELLAHDGFMGLRGACRNLGDGLRDIGVPDPGCIMDADTPAEYQRLITYLEHRDQPGDLRCRELQRWFQMPEKTIRHCDAVAKLAVEMTEALKKNSQGTWRREQIYAAALLHDVAKGQPRHGETGARMLRLLGHETAAALMEHHMDGPQDKASEDMTICEEAVVYLADKLTRENRRCTLEERFEKSMEKFAGQPEALEAVRRRLEEARGWKKQLDQVTKNIW